jgi:hypothetical protein
MLVYETQKNVDCRTVIVPACEADTIAEQGTPIPALACFQMRMRDTIDFAVDFSQWLAKNGGAVLSNAQFAVASDSPKTPVIVGQAFAPSGKCLIALSKHVSSPAVGDAYWLDITATVAAVTPVGGAAIPARTLVSRIHVVLVNG